MLKAAYLVEDREVWLSEHPSFACRLGRFLIHIVVPQAPLLGISLNLGAF